jgi:hypothetical protein
VAQVAGVIVEGWPDLLTFAVLALAFAAGIVALLWR